MNLNFVGGDDLFQVKHDQLMVLEVIQLLQYMVKQITKRFIGFLFHRSSNSSSEVHVEPQNQQI